MLHSSVPEEHVELLTKVQAWTKLWQPRFHLPEWNIYVNLCEPEIEDEDWAAECRVQAEYLSAVIVVNPSGGWHDFESEDEFTVVHELGHVLLGRTRNLGGTMLPRRAQNDYYALDEEATERLARSIWYAYGGQNLADLAAPGTMHSHAAKTTVPGHRIHGARCRYRVRV